MTDQLLTRQTGFSESFTSNNLLTIFDNMTVFLDAFSNTSVDESVMKVYVLRGAIGAQRVYC